MVTRRIVVGVSLVAAVALGALAYAQQAPTGKETVYVTKTGAKYHRATCSSLSKSAIPMTLTAASARYGPCSRCKPPVMAPSAGSSTTSAPRALASPPATNSGDGRCQAITKKGTQCSRRAQSGSSYCWQHQR